jgi:hypothetical protein
VTNMHKMFEEAHIFNNDGKPLEWVTSNVRNMSGMFSNAKAFNQPLEWDTRNVTNMQGMFINARGFNNGGKPLEWVTSNVTDMSNMFQDASAFNQPLEWDTRKVTNMSNMFGDASAFNNGGKPLEWDTSNVTNMQGMFIDAKAFNNGGEPLEFDTRNVTTMVGMFHNARRFNQPLAWDTRNVKGMSGMFGETVAFNNGGQPLAFDTRNVTNMSFMFAKAKAFNQPLVWDTRNVTNMRYMFTKAEAFNNGGRPLAWDTRNVTDMERRFAGASAFTNGGREDLSPAAIAATIATSDCRRAEWDAQYAYKLLQSLHDALWEANETTDGVKKATVLRGAIVNSDNYYTRPYFGLAEDIDEAAINEMPIEDVLQAYIVAVERVGQSVEGQTWEVVGEIQELASVLLAELFRPPESEQQERPRVLRDAESAFVRRVRQRTIAAIAAAGRLRMGTLCIVRRDREATTGAPPPTPHTNETLRAAVTEWLDIFKVRGREAIENKWGGSITHWDTSNVTDMSFMFKGARSFNVTLAWDTRNVTNMDSMFANATAFNNGGHPLEWVTSNVTDMSWMFYNAEGLNQPLAWDTGKVEDMQGMFNGADRFTNDGRPLEWDTRNVTDMSYMFSNARTFNNGGQPLEWDTRNVTNMAYMFNRADAFNQPLAWDTRNVTNMNGMFYSARTFNNGGQPLEWDTSNVTNMTGMFYNARNLNQSLAWKNTSNADTRSMFDLTHGNVLLLSPEAITATLATSDRRRAAWDAKYAYELLQSLYHALREANETINVVKKATVLRGAIVNSDNYTRPYFGLAEDIDEATINEMTISDVLQAYIAAVEAIRESVEGQTWEVVGPIQELASALLAELLRPLESEQQERPRVLRDAGVRVNTIEQERRVRQQRTIAAIAAAERLRLGTLCIVRRAPGIPGTCQR